MQLAHQLPLLTWVNASLYRLKLIVYSASLVEKTKTLITTDEGHINRVGLSFVKLARLFWAGININLSHFSNSWA